MNAAIINMLRTRGLINAEPDLYTAQNQVNRLIYQFGKLGRLLDIWFRTGRHDPAATTDAALDLLLDAYALAINACGSERFDAALAARVAAWTLQPGITRR